MGSPSCTYEEMLREYVRISSHVKSDDLASKNIHQLEIIAQRLKNENYPLACYYAGVATSNFINDPNIGCDTLNASISGIGMLQDFFSINGDE